MTLCVVVWRHDTILPFIFLHTIWQNHLAGIRSVCHTPASLPCPSIALLATYRPLLLMDRHSPVHFLSASGATLRLTRSSHQLIVNVALYSDYTQTHTTAIAMTDYTINLLLYWNCLGECRMWPLLAT